MLSDPPICVQARGRRRLLCFVWMCDCVFVLNSNTLTYCGAVVAGAWRGVSQTVVRKLFRAENSVEIMSKQIRAMKKIFNLNRF